MLSSTRAHTQMRNTTRRTHPHTTKQMQALVSHTITQSHTTTRDKSRRPVATLLTTLPESSRPRGQTL